MEPLILRLFDSLSDAWKVVALVVLVTALVATSIWRFAGWRHERHLKKDLARSSENLQRISQERDQLQKRFESLATVDGHVWTRADAFKHDHFIHPADRKTRFIAVCNLKGGVGKTTLAVNIGSCLALRGRRVLLIDLDFQGTLSNLVLERGLLLDYRRKGWTLDALLCDDLGHEGMAQYTFAVAGVPNCRAVLAKEALEMVEFAQQAKFYVNPEHEVRFTLQKLLHAGPVLQEYDYVFFDCPPRLSTACVNGLACADYVIAPTSLSQSDIEAVPRTLNWLRMLQPIMHGAFLGAVISRCAMRSGKLIRYEEGQLNNLKSLIENHLVGTSYVFDSKIPVKPAIYQATDAGRPAVLDPEVRPWFEPVSDELERRIHR